MPTETIIILIFGFTGAVLIGYSIFSDDIKDARHRRQVRKMTRPPKKIRKGKKIPRRLRRGK